MEFVYILTGIVLARVVYKSYFTPLKTVEDYHKRSFYFDTVIQARKTALKVLDEGIASTDLTDLEKASLKLKAGIISYRLKNNEQAKEYFEDILVYIRKGKFPYTKDISAVVLTYYNLGEKDKARQLYHFLVAKESYDGNFGKLRYLDNYIWK